jgi:hypothetical protein
LVVRRGERVAFLARNRPELAIAEAATLHLGAAGVVLYAASPPATIEHVLRDSEPLLLLVESELDSRLSEVRHGVPQTLTLDGASMERDALTTIAAPVTGTRSRAARHALSAAIPANSARRWVKPGLRASRARPRVGAELTETVKLRRAKIESKYAAEIEALYILPLSPRAATAGPKGSCHASASCEGRRDYTMAVVNRARASKLALNGLIWGRMTFGVAAWLAPRPLGRALGLDMAGNPQAAYLARVLAVRDLVLACGAYGTDGEAQWQWLFAGLVCDSADTLAGIAAGRGGYLPKRTSVYLTGFALSGVAAAAAVLRERSGAASA